MFKTGSPKAQTSFEMVIITTLVIIVILGALRLVPSISVSTGKIAVLKSEALKVLSEQKKFYYIADIEEPVIYTDPDEITIVIGGSSVDATLEQQLRNLDQKLVDAKFYSDASDITIIVQEA